jgi:hypothetical protein
VLQASERGENTDCLQVSDPKWQQCQIPTGVCSGTSDVPLVTARQRLVKKEDNKGMAGNAAPTKRKGISHDDEAQASHASGTGSAQRTSGDEEVHVRRPTAACAGN